MHSNLSRTAVAVATLALGSAVLAATPATAATPPGVTRDTILTAINGAHASDINDSSYSDETETAIRTMVNRVCAVDYDADEDIDYAYIEDAETDGSAQGGLVEAQIDSYNDEESSYRTCVFGIVATTDGDFDLTGTANLTGTLQPVNDGPIEISSTAVSTLSGNAFVTSPMVSPANRYYTTTSFTATGSAAKTISVSAESQVPDKKSAAEKKAAKTKYVQRIASAKKKYAAALDKADTKAERSAAKATYKARRASAKAKFQYAVATYKNVTKTSTSVDNRPFSLSAGYDYSESL